MINQLILVGRLMNNLELKEIQNKKKVVITLGIPRSYRNTDGEYDTDFVSVTLLGQIAENTVEYCRKGDLIGIKGRLTRLNGEKMRVVAEKVTFLSSKRNEVKEND